MSSLVRLEILNFKSYEGQQTIGPFKRFSSIIGPNGSGKSNLMEAISFVLGIKGNDKGTDMRGKNLIDFVHNKEEKLKCSVKLVFLHAETNKEYYFVRSINPGAKASEYHLNGKVVGAQVYQQKLADFGINVKARNFMFFQNDSHIDILRHPKKNHCHA